MSNVSAKVAHLASPRQRLASALDIARVNADDVDQKGRFPQEAIEALKKAQLMGIMIPVECGGENASLADIVDMCGALGQACASTAMIFAMHHIKVSSLVTHGLDSNWHRDFMRRVVDEQFLIGSATTEGGIGGDVRNSICAIEPEGDSFTLTKEANVISYGLNADAIMVTARRNTQAASSDQVMTVIEREQYALQMTIPWDTLGMRGTCSEGFLFKCRAPSNQIFPHPFAEIAAQSMLAMSHLMWAGVWFGIAADATTRAQNYLRAEARKKPGSTPPAAVRLAEMFVLLQEMKSVVMTGIVTYEKAKVHSDTLSSVGFSIAMNNVKIATSQAVVDIVQSAMMIAGISSYRTGGKFSLGRHMRDALSAAIMVNNDRIVANTSNLTLVSKYDTNLVA